MAWHLDVVNLLAQAALGGTLVLAAGFVAVRACRQPVRRIRLTELTLLGLLLVPFSSRVSWLPHWSAGLLPRPAAEAAAEPAQPTVESLAFVPASAAPALPVARGEQAAPAAARVRSDWAVALLTSPPGADAPGSPAEPSATTRVPLLIVTAYGGAMAALAAWLLAGLAGLVRLYRSTYPVPPEVAELFHDIAGPRADAVRLCASDRLDTPVAFAGWRPIIVLPGALCRGGDRAALRYSLAHEWSHVEGGDVWRWYLTGLVQLVYFFHPLVWWLRGQLRLCQDYLADARAAEHAAGTEHYAEYLVGLCRRRLVAPAAALGIGGRRSHLYRRVTMLLQARERPERRCLWTWNAAAVLAGLAVLGLCSAVRLDAADEPAAKEAPAAKKAPEQPPAKGETLHYTGRVTDKDTGKPIAGATVTVRRSLLGDPEAREENRVMQETKHKTDAAGKYHFTIPPEQSSKRYLYIELDVEHPNYAPQGRFGYALSMIRKNEKMGERPFFENVTLRAGEPISGTLRTPDGRPAPGVKVLAYSVTRKAKGGFEYGSFTDCRSDKDGKFRLVVVTPGAAVFWILPEKYIPTTHRVKDGQRGDLGTFTLLPGLSLRGKVLDVRGKPVAGVNVNLERNGRGEELQDLMVADAIARSAVTDARGEFVMAPLAAGDYHIQPDPRVRDGSQDRRKKYPEPGVFLRQKVTLTEAVAKTGVEVRESPHVVIETQFFDSKGKPTRGHAWHVFGRLDKSFWFGQAQVDPSGKGVLKVPHGLEDVRISLMNNEHGSQRFRLARGKPLARGREINLGTLLEDVRGVEIVRYVAPVVLVKVRTKDGTTPTEVRVSALYGAKKNGKAAFFPVNGDPTDVFFNKQKDGRLRTSQLLPDEDVTIQARAEGYATASVTVRLPEDTTRDVELVLEKSAPK
jgi:beta-lactamase regulating signal transducer with metallopeptidase domain/protocatechuate 3,4-dioxygenase beta subunit